MGGLLVFIVYLIHKSFKERREEREFSAKAARLPDENTFATAALQGDIDSAGPVLRHGEKESAGGNACGKAVLRSNVRINDAQGQHIA